MPEIELKLRLRARDVAPLRARLGRLAPPRVARVDNTYFDTPDLRLAQARAALRLRRIAGADGEQWVQTFKTEATAETALAVRGEWETPLPAPRIDLGRLRAPPLKALLGARPRLAPLFRTDFERTTWDLRLRGARIEAALDIGAITARGAREPLCELELELHSGPPLALLDLAIALCSPPGAEHPDLSLLPYAASKAARGYRLSAQGAMPAAPLRSGSERVADLSGVSAAAAARGWVSAAVHEVLFHAEGLRDGGDPDHVHQARVALRRVRAGLSLLGASARLPAGERTALAQWARALGAVRSWDVLLEGAITTLAKAAPGARRGAWERLREAVHQRRAAACAALCRDLAQPAFALFALRLLRWSASPARGARPLRTVLPPALSAARSAFARDVRQFGDLPPRRQHKLRLRAKRLRYGFELARALGPGTAREDAALLRALARFQDAAGALRDAEQAQQVLRPLLRSRADVEHLEDWTRRRMQRQGHRARKAAHRLHGKD